MPFLKKVFGKSDGNTKAKKNAVPATNGHVAPVKPQWTDAWTRTTIHAEEVAELIRGCTIEIKARALTVPFLLLPFRPTSDPSATRTFIRNYFSPPSGRNAKGEELMRELRLTEPIVLASVMKWCWSRLPGGVVGWDSYELFKVGEHDSRYARDAFSTFIPISVDSDARTQVIFDFFDLMAALAAHGKSNGLGGRKLSRYAGWWAFEHTEAGKGFEPGYRTWEKAGDATSHLFFAYLRSLSPERATAGNLKLPLSLQTLLQQTEYPPEAPTLMFNSSTRVVMIVDSVSPTPFALLRRAKNFEYRSSDRDLQQFSEYEDPVRALTDECRRVLRSISSSNESGVSKSSDSTGLRDASWSRFEDMGFGAPIEEDEAEGGTGDFRSMANRERMNQNQGLRRSPNSQTNDLGRPTTPSWADFLSTGFGDEASQKAPSLLLPPDKQLPPINTVSKRGHSSQSHRRGPHAEPDLQPGELASINKIDLDDAFWWVWISSLSGEEPTSRKAVFGRCALLETIIPGGKWLIMEEQVKGAEAAQPAPDAYVAEKKGFFSFASRKKKLERRKSAAKKQDPYSTRTVPSSKTTIGPDQHARIQAAAAALHRRDREQEDFEPMPRRGRNDDAVSTKTSSVFTLQPVIMSEASPAMKWASQYDKAEIRKKYLGDGMAGKGASTEMLTLPPNGISRSGSAVSLVSSNGRKSPQPPVEDKPVPALPEPEATPVKELSADPEKDKSLTPPPLPEVAPEDVHPLNREAQQAAEVPLPLETPIKEPTPVATPEPAPEEFTRVPTRTQVPEPAEPVQSSPQPQPQPQPQLSPESSKDHKKLQKKNQGGFKKSIFGSKRINRKEVGSPPAKSPPPSDSSAVAAARAALEGKSKATSGQKNNLAPPEPIPKSRRFGMRDRPAQRAAQMAKRPVTPPNEAPPTPVTEESTPTADRFQVDRPRTYRDEEYDQLSRVDTEEREDADREFSQFDQGPLSDQPAFVPEHTPEETSYETPAEERQEQPMPAHYHAATTLQDPVPEENEEEYEGNQPSPPVETSPQAPGSPVQVNDRWAQIRKNAAERAARQSEEQSRVTDKTDDGETSGEETIESRVARIKARVAELTGNMEASRK